MQHPNPTDATTIVEDEKYPTGVVHVPVPERERRKKDIDLVDPNHPLLPLALHCLKDRDTERPSADELCGRLATLTREQNYEESLEQSREQRMESVEAAHKKELGEWQRQLQQKDEDLQEKDEVIARLTSEIEELRRQLQEEQRAPQAEPESIDSDRQNNTAAPTNVSQFIIG